MKGKPKRRVYVHATPKVDSRVLRWIWTSNKGLRVEYRDGHITKSQYTLPELLGPDQPEGPVLLQGGE